MPHDNTDHKPDTSAGGKKSNFLNRFLQGWLRKVHTPLKRRLQNPAIRFFLLSLILMLWPIAVLFHHVSCPWPAAFIFALSDSLLILIPFWWIKKRRWLILIPLWLSAIFVEVNLLMLGWSDELMTFRSIFMTGNVNDAVTANIPALMKPVNYLIIAALIAYTVFYARYRRKMKGVRFSRRSATKATIASLIFFIVIQCALQIRWYSDMRLAPGNAAGISRWSLVQRFNSRNNIRKRDLIYKGYDLYVLNNLLQLVNSYKLSDASRKEIDSFLLSKKAPSNSHDEFSANREKNLIIIIVESLNGYAVDAMTGNRYVMPNLHALAQSQGTVSNLNVVPQIKDGSSGDGHLLINSGLLPIKDGSANLEYGVNTNFVSVNRMIPDHKSQAIFAEDGGTWAEKNIFYSFGFDNVTTSLDYDGRKLVNDGEMLSYFIKAVAKMPQPFFMECITMGMHSPFDILKEPMPEWIAESGLSPEKQRYYHACNHFDTYLGKLIESLKESGKWDNTVLMVISDHSIATDEKGPDARYFSNIPMAFIAANTGVTERMDKTAGQVDIFPTILDIMGVAGDNSGVLDIEGKMVKWRGLGTSMFSDDVTGAVDPKGRTHGTMTPSQEAEALKAYDISDMIIRGYYLNELQENKK